MSWTPEYKQLGLSIAVDEKWPLMHPSLRCPNCGNPPVLDEVAIGSPMFRVVCVNLDCKESTGYRESSQEAIAVWKMKCILTKS